MNIPQVILLILFGVSLLLSANQHGKQKEGTYNFWPSFIAIVLQLFLLYWGGFF